MTARTPGCYAALPAGQPAQVRGSPLHGRNPVASAPCNFGVYELHQEAPEPDAVLEVVAAAGYDGIDLGPVGYLGTGERLRGRLSAHGLALAGAWVQLAPDLGLEPLEPVLACFDDAADLHALPPRPTLAAGGPADPRVGRPPRLDADGWHALVGLLAQAATRCRERGYEPTFHPHIGTWVETVEQTDALLAACDLGLCLDTGHAVLGGARLPRDLDRWMARINHVHLKDVRVRRLAALTTSGASLHAVWASEVFCPLGAGDIALEAVLERLGRYAGWVVVEQDRSAGHGLPMDEVARTERRNRLVVGGSA